MREVIMGYQGEMSLKGLNRNQFESTMMKILRYRLKTVGKFRVYCTQSTFYMEPEEEDIDMDLAFERVSKVFGLAALSRAVVCEKDFDTICQTAEDYLGDSLHGIKTFKVEARRSDKTFPMTSPELMRELGAYLLGRHNYLRVDVKNPQFKVIVEIRDYGAYIHGPKIRVRVPAGGHLRPRPQYAVRRHRQPCGGIPDGKARPRPRPHPFCVPSVYF